MDKQLFVLVLIGCIIVGMVTCLVGDDKKMHRLGFIGAMFAIVAMFFLIAMQ